MQMAYDLERTSRFAIFGASMGPLGGAWNSQSFLLLDAISPPAPTLHCTGSKMLT